MSWNSHFNKLATSSLWFSGTNPSDFLSSASVWSWLNIGVKCLSNIWVPWNVLRQKLLDQTAVYLRTLSNHLFHLLNLLDTLARNQNTQWKKVTLRPAQMSFFVMMFSEKNNRQYKCYKSNWGKQVQLFALAFLAQQEMAQQGPPEAKFEV